MLRHLIETNLALLAQGRHLLASIDDEAYSTRLYILFSNSAGAQLRHILEFYECLLDGLPHTSIDYDARRRDHTLETSRTAALNRIDHITHRLAGITEDRTLQVHVDEAVTPSSLARELQSLVSHTIHHYALIAVAMRLQGLPVDPQFGVAPSTLRYQLQQAA
ncbi:MAG: DinB family protein [Bryobacteraceae bacterium]